VPVTLLRDDLALRVSTGMGNLELRPSPARQKGPGEPDPFQSSLDLYRTEQRHFTLNSALSDSPSAVVVIRTR
jgi:hypothetical protein